MTQEVQGEALNIFDKFLFSKHGSSRSQMFFKRGVTDVLQKFRNIHRKINNCVGVSF